MVKKAIKQDKQSELFLSHKAASLEENEEDIDITFKSADLSDDDA